jgi:hypothetical protein
LSLGRKTNASKEKEKKNGKKRKKKRKEEVLINIYEGSWCFIVSLH